MKKLYSIALLMMSTSLSILAMEIDDIDVAGDEYGNVEAVEIDINPKQIIPYTPLLKAIIGHDIVKVKELLEAGADVNADINIKNKEKFTALHYAARWNGANTVELLIDAGADVNAVDKTGRTPLHWAVDNTMNKEDMIENMTALIKAGADVNAKDNDGNTALHKALSESRTYPAKYIKAIKLLIDNDADLTIQNISGQTPLDLANQEVLNWIELTDKVA